MSDCKDCTKRNPVTPVYSRAPGLPRPCTTCRNGVGNFIIPPGGGGTGKSTELIEGFSIGIDDLSDTITDRFRINWEPVEQLTVDLSLVAKSGGNTQSNPVLWGTTIDEANLTWAYNRELDVQAQTLVSSPTLGDPTLDALTRNFDYTPISVKNVDTSFTISGDDGGGIPESTAQDTESILFGNYAAWGVWTRSEGINWTDLKAQAELFLKDTARRVNTRTRVRNLFGEGGVLEHFYYVYPKRYGYATFTKNNSPGGFKRLKRVGALVQVATNLYSPDPDEEDMLLSNTLEEEDYHIYQSYADNIADDVTPIIIT